MNTHTRFRASLATADDPARRRWSVAEIEQMVAAGIIAEHERIELIDGEVVVMSPKGARHEMIKIALNRFFQRAAPDNLEIAPETTLRLDQHSFVEPDFCVFKRGIDLKSLDGPKVLLAIEVADSSLAYDTGRKIGIYAAYGVREVWVVNANTLVTRVHRNPAKTSYRTKRDLAPARRLVPASAADLAVCLTDLGLAPIADAT